MALRRLSAKGAVDFSSLGKVVERSLFHCIFDFMFGNEPNCIEVHSKFYTGMGKWGPMKWTAFLSTVAFVTAASAGAQASAGSSPDADFVKVAQQHALGQYALGSLASGKAQNPQVKSLAQKLTSNAGNANTFIKKYAATHNVAVTNRPHVRAASQYGDIQDLKGKDFDSKFVMDVNMDVQLAADDYKDEVDHGTDPQLKSFAKQQLDLFQQVTATADKLSH